MAKITSRTHIRNTVIMNFPKQEKRQLILSE